MIMAIIFELWAECKDEQASSLLAHHFDGFKLYLSTGNEITVTVELVPNSTKLFGVIVRPSSLSLSGVRTLQDAIETTEVGLQLYYHLKSAPDFCFARINWEAELITMFDLPDFVEALHNGDKRLQIECVIDNSLYEKIGKPIFCYPFREGYWWTRYGGETYHPLWSNDQQALTEYHRRLFPENFGD
jgi:hypothetical protein